MFGRSRGESLSVVPQQGASGIWKAIGRNLRAMETGGGWVGYEA